jgi:hypothetical protein
LGAEPTISGGCFAVLFATTLIKALQSRQTVVSPEHTSDPLLTD